MIGNDYTNAAMSDSSYDIMDAYDYFKKGLEIRELTLGETSPSGFLTHVVSVRPSKEVSSFCT